MGHVACFLASPLSVRSEAETASNLSEYTLSLYMIKQKIFWLKGLESLHMSSKGRVVGNLNLRMAETHHSEVRELMSNITHVTVCFEASWHQTKYIFLNGQWKLTCEFWLHRVIDIEVTLQGI